MINRDKRFSRLDLVTNFGVQHHAHAQIYGVTLFATPAAQNLDRLPDLERFKLRARNRFGDAFTCCCLRSKLEPLQPRYLAPLRGNPPFKRCVRFATGEFLSDFLTVSGSKPGRAQDLRRQRDAKFFQNPPAPHP